MKHESNERDFGDESKSNKFVFILFSDKIVSSINS